MTSQTLICNMALGNAAARATITSINENSAEAYQCNLYYDSVRQEILRAVNWNFARSQITLSLIGTAILGTSQTPWTYKYAYPSDCLKARYIIDSCANNISLDLLNPYVANKIGVPFVVGADKDSSGNDIKVILTSMQNAVLQYTRDISSVYMFDDQFVMAFTHLLASRITMPLTGKVDIARSEYDNAIKTLDKAQVTDGNEGLTVQDSLPDWIRTRGYAGDWMGLWGTGYNDYPQFIGI